MGITHACFGLSYLTAFGLALCQQMYPGRVIRYAGIAFGVAGVLAHTLFLIFHQPSAATPYGSLLLLAWGLGIFYLYEGLISGRPTWTVFVLPIVTLLVGISFLFIDTDQNQAGSWFTGDHFWGVVHGGLLIASSVGITVGFLASGMYLVQGYRLRRKLPPIGGMKIFNLERLETVNRRSINMAFPLLTIGLLLGAMQVRSTTGTTANWTELKILTTVGLWGTALLLMYLRYGVHLPGRRLAWLTILTFALMLITLAASHPFAHGDTR